MSRIRALLQTSPSLRTSIAGLAAACVALAACDVTEPGETKLTLQIAPARATCMTMFVRECLRVRTLPDTAWTLFDDAIEGFDYQVGYTYTITVARRTVKDPPADASSLAYRLLAIIRKDPG